MTISFFERGEGDVPVLMLHGFLGSGRNLGSLSQRLSERRPDLRLYVCDLPGHGTSAPLVQPLGLSALVAPIADFAATLAEKHGRPLLAVGHSMGGRVALSLSRTLLSQIVMLDIAPGPIGDRNKDLESLALAYANAPAHAESRDEMRAHLQSTGLSRPLADWLLMNLENKNGALSWRVDRQALIELGRATRGDDLWPLAHQYASALSCVYGERSGFVTPEDVARLADLGAHVIPVKDAGHFVHVDALETLVSTLERILMR